MHGGAKRGMVLIPEALNRVLTEYLVRRSSRALRLAMSDVEYTTAAHPSVANTGRGVRDVRVAARYQSIVGTRLCGYRNLCMGQVRVRILLQFEGTAHQYDPYERRHTDDK